VSDHQLAVKEITPDMTFREASDAWLLWMQFQPGNENTRVRYKKPRTVASYAQYVKALNRFFGPIRLDQISSAQIREYQQKRTSGLLSTPADDILSPCCEVDEGHCGGG
jgi:hypothetical protein